MCLTPATPNIGAVGSDYMNLVGQFAQGVPTQLNTETAYKPGFVDTALNASNLSLFGGPNATGVLGQFEGALEPTAGALNSANYISGQGAVGQVGGLGADAAAAVESVNPSNARLVNDLTDTTSTQLAAGTRLLPSDVSRITSSVRGDWASRGLGDSGPAQLDEALQLYGGGEAALAQREAAATNAINVSGQNITLPALGLATTQSTAPGVSQNLLGGAGQLAQNASSSLVPTSQLSDVLSTVYNARSAANIAGANNRAGVIGSALSY